MTDVQFVFTKILGYGKYLYIDIHSDSFRSKRKKKPFAKTLVGNCLQIHVGHHRREKTKSNYYKWGRRPRTYFHRFQTLSKPLRFSKRYKNNSSRFINEKGWVNGKFAWQAGYGAFSYGHSQIERVYQYISNQEKHHQKKSFKQEYFDFLEKFNVDFKEEYLFDFLD